MSLQGKIGFYLSKIFDENPDGITLDEIAEQVIKLERIERESPKLYEGQTDQIKLVVCEGMMFKRRCDDFCKLFEEIYFFDLIDMNQYRVEKYYYDKHHNEKPPRFVNWYYHNRKYYLLNRNDLNDETVKADLINAVRVTLAGQLSKHSELNSLTYTEFLRQFALGMSRINATGIGRGYTKDKISYENIDLRMIWPKD